MKRSCTLNLTFAAMTIVTLAACGGQSNLFSARPGATYAGHAVPDGLLNGEAFSSTTATSTCHVDKMGAVHGKFHVSGTASGPFPGTFSQSGSIVVQNGYVFSSRFNLQSGSKSLTGDERYLWSGGGSQTCSGGALSFGFSHGIKYHVRHMHTGGLATPTLDGSTFTESFNEQ